MSQQSVIKVNGTKDLPLHCPNNNSPAWSMHPRVFLDVLTTGHAKCPYCGNEYELEPGTKPHGH